MVAFRYLVHNAAQRVGSESATLIASPSLVGDLVASLQRVLPEIFLKTPRHDSTSAAALTSSPPRGGDAAVSADVARLLAAVMPHTPVPLKETVVHAVWGTTAGSRGTFLCAGMLDLADVLTQRASALSVMSLLELVQLVVKVEMAVRHEAGWDDETVWVSDTLMKRLIDAVFDWIPRGDEPIQGDTLEALVCPLPGGTRSRYAGTNQLRRQRKVSTDEQHSVDGSAVSGHPRMNRDELMVMVMSLAAHARRRLPASAQRSENGATALVDDEQAAKLTDCLRRMCLVRHLRQVATTRALEAVEWTFFLSLLGSPVTTWRQLASEALLSLDTPFGSLGARFCAEADLAVAGHEIRSIAQSAPSLKALDGTLQALLSLLAVSRSGERDQPSEAETAVVVVSPVVSTLSVSQMLALVRLLSHLHLFSASAAADVRESSPLHGNAQLQRHAENVFTVLVERLSRHADGTSTETDLQGANKHDGDRAPTTISPIALLRIRLDLCTVKLRKWRTAPLNTTVESQLLSLIDETLETMTGVFHSLLVNGTGAKQGDPQPRITGAPLLPSRATLAAVLHVLPPLPHFFDELSVVCAQLDVTTSSGSSLWQRVAQARVALLDVFSQLASDRLLVGKTFASAVALAGMEHDDVADVHTRVPLAMDAALVEAQRRFALEAAVVTLAAPFPEYQPAMAPASSGAETTFFVLSNFRKALQLCFEHNIALETIEQHATARGVTFDLPRFLRLLLSRAESEDSPASVVPSASAKVARYSPSESELPSQLLSVVQCALKLGALQSEDALIAVATNLRAWTASDTVIHNMNWESRVAVLNGLCTLYTAIYPHYNVSRASRTLGLTCLRVAARLSLNRLSPPAQAAWHEPVFVSQCHFLWTLWRFYTIALTHTFHSTQRVKYLGIMQSYVVKRVNLLCITSPRTRAKAPPLPESTLAPLEALFTEVFCDQSMRYSDHPLFTRLVAGKESGFSRQDLVVIMEWNLLLVRLSRLTLSVLIDCQTLQEGLRHRRFAAIAESVLALCRIILAVQSALLPSAWNRVRHTLSVFLALNDSLAGASRKNGHVALAFTMSVRVVWRYAELQGNKGCWATAAAKTRRPNRAAEHSTDRQQSRAERVADASNTAELIDRRTLVRLFSVQEALLSAPDLVEQIACRLCDAMRVQPGNSGSGGGEGRVGLEEADQKIMRHDEMAILRAFRSMKPSSY